MSTRLASQPPAIRHRELAVVVVTGLLYAVGMAIAVPALRLPAYVDQLTIENPHAWRVTVDVTGSERDGWLGLGAVDRDTENTFDDVVDQGDTWIIDFAYGGEHTDLRVSRTQLEEDDWHVTVPDELADRLRAAGVPETPP